MLFAKLPDLLVGWPPLRRLIHSAPRAPTAGPRDRAARHRPGLETNFGPAEAPASTK